jgi:hypothetical protein
MRPIIGISAISALVALVSIAQPSGPPPPKSAIQIVLRSEQVAAIDETHPGAQMRFTIEKPPTTAQTMVILDANAEPIAASGNKRMEATAFLYGSGTHRVKAEVYDDQGHLVGTTGTTVPVTVTAKVTAAENGISVGLAKQFDDRALVVMLRDVELALQAQQTGVFKSVADAVGRFQGQTADRSFFGVTATTLPTPGTSTEGTTKTTDTGATGSSEVKTDTAGTTTTTKSANPSQNVESTLTDKTTQAAVTPNSVQPPPPSAVTFTQTTLGVGAEDLLNEQANLSAQYMSLRLLLQRSLSDRVVMRANGTSEPRTQPVYGFQISIDPARKYRDAVAEAIVTISLPPDDQSGLDAPRLVTLLPKEKTYNVAEVTSRSRAFSLGGIVQVVNVGAAFNQSRETLYVVKDTDTVALEKTLPGASARNATAFSWQFRPVLGKRVVSPGARQVFAVLALPTSINERWEGIVSITTQWRRYDRKTKTAGDVIRDSVNHQEPYRIVVSRLQEQETAVASTIEGIDLRAAGSAALITVDGHFPSGTLVSVADTIIDTPANGMLLKTPRRMTFVVAAERLFFAPTLIDSFGVATELLLEGGDTPPNFQVVAAGQEERFAVYLRSNIPAPRADLFAGDTFAKHLLADETYAKSILPWLRSNRSTAVQLKRPLVLIGHTVFGLSDAPVIQQAGSAACSRGKNAKLCDQLTQAMTKEKLNESDITKLTFDVSPAVAQDARVVRVLDPFYGQGKFVENPITFASPTKVVTIGDLQFVDISNAEAQLALSGQLLTNADGLTLRIGGTVCKRVGVAAESVVIFACDTAALATATRAIVTYTDAEPKLLSIPPLPSLRVQVVRQERIREGEVRAVRLEGNDLSTVASARYNGTALRISHDSGNSDTLYVDVPAAVTSSPGDKLVQLLLNDGRIVQTVLTVDAKPRG